MPRFLFPLIPEFVELRRGDLQSAMLAVQNADWDSLRRIGHIFKGSGGSYGLSQVSQWGAQLESAAGSQDRALATELIAQLDHYLLHLRVESDG